MINLNRNRQGDWFKGNEYDKEVHVIGVGATGSFVAYQLAKMGVQKLHVWDFDVVEEHNVANQIYNIMDEGKYKVDALAEHIKESVGLDIITHNEKVTSANKNELKGVVFVLTDTMASRKDIFSALKYNMNVSLVVETRMGIDCGRIYVINPLSVPQIKRYEDTFYDDDVAEVSFCGSSLSIIPTAMNIASYACWAIIKDYKEIEQDNEILIDYVYNNVIASKF